MCLVSHDEEIRMEQSYQLKELGENSKKNREYITRSNDYDETTYQTTSIIIWELTSIYLYLEKVIVSGVFCFDAVDSEGNIIKVRVGCFNGAL